MSQCAHCTIASIASDARSDDDKTAARVSSEIVSLVDATSPPGQGFGGPVVSAAHDAAIGVLAPDAGLAVLQVLTDASGAVTQVRVVSASGDLPMWNGVASAMARSMKGTSLKLPAAASGAQVTVEVRVRAELPSGSDPNAKVKILGVGGSFDFSDIGAKPMRVVAVHELSEARL